MTDIEAILALAEEIRRVDGNHDKGAAQLAQDLMPFILKMRRSWQPIETAPKDGTHILAVVKGFVPAVAKWVPESGSFEYMDACNFNRIEYYEDYMNSTIPWSPTHWMPLPEPPND